MGTAHLRDSITCILLFVVAHSQSLPVQNVPPGFGAIRGRVVNELGKPLPGAKVYVEPIDTKYAPVGKLRFVTTNDQGDFLVGEVASGGNLVCASKEEAFYPDTCAAALAADLGALPRVRVEEGQVTRGVTVSLSKGGKFTGTILDSQSGRPLINSRIRLSRSDDPRLFVSTGPDEQARFEFVIPSKPFKIEISSPGYKTWNSDKHGGTILVEPESTKEITIRLQRTEGATPN